MDVWIDGEMCGWTDECVNGYVWMDRRICGRQSGQMDVWMDRRMCGWQ